MRSHQELLEYVYTPKESGFDPLERRQFRISEAILEVLCDLRDLQVYKSAKGTAKN